MMNKLFRAASLTNRGTLFQLKNDFGHRAVTNDVMNSFNHVENFVRFVTEAHVVYLALKLFGNDDVGGTPTTDCDSLDKILSTKSGCCLRSLTSPMYSTAPSTTTSCPTTGARVKKVECIFQCNVISLIEFHLHSQA